MEGDRHNRTTPKRNKISRCFISSARNVLHFLGIHNHSDDDEIWEQRILERIENKAFALWNVDDSTDDATEGLVREVWSTVSEVLSEDDHIPHEAETQPSHTQNKESEFSSITEDKHYKKHKTPKHDWNQSAKSIKDISQGPMVNEQVLPTDSTTHSTSAIQDSLVKYQEEETPSQGSPESDVQSNQDESECPTANENPTSGSQNDQASIPNLDKDPEEGEAENLKKFSPSEKVGSDKPDPQQQDKPEGSKVPSSHDTVGSGGNIESDKQKKSHSGEKIEMTSSKITVEERDTVFAVKEDHKTSEHDMNVEIPNTINSDEDKVQSTSDNTTDSDENKVPRTLDNDVNINEKQKSVRFSEVEDKHESNEMEKAHLSEMKEIGTMSGVQLKDALDLAGGEMTADEQRKLNEILNSGLLAYGKEAYRNYSLYVQIERKNKVRKLRESKELAMDKMEWRISKLDEIIDTAREYYQNPSGKSAQAWNDLRRSIKSNTTVRLGSDTDVDIRFKLTKLHSHRPIFTNTIMLIQILVFSVLCYFGGLTKIGFEPVLELSEGIPTYLGKETVHRWVKPNIWIGPNEKFWISVGALFSSCMREDYKLMLEISKKNYSSSAVLGCCEVAIRNTAGTMTQEECDQETGGVGVWKSGVPCGSRAVAEMSVSHNIKPCCVNTRGECRMVSHQHCHFMKGIYHKDNREHCSQVNCIGDFCTGKLGFMIKMSSKPDEPWLPESPQQWWRLPLSVLYHYGIIHCLLVVGAQAMFLRQIEITIGWLRMMILYVVCGCGGLLAAVIFNPYQPHVGATGALFGAVGLLFVELVHFWSIIRRPWLELIKLLTIMAVFIFSGTLPYLNIFSILTGLLLGMLCALGLLPYISIKRHKALCRIIIVAVSIPLVITIFFVMFYVFYKVQLLENCKFCKFVNCYPYTENMCKLLD